MSARRVQGNSPVDSTDLELILRNVQVKANLFEIRRLPEHLVFFQYQDLTRPNSSKLVIRKHEIMSRLQSENAAVFTPRALYDGQSSLYSTKDLSETRILDVHLRRDRSDPIRVTLTRVAAIDMSVLRQLTKRGSPNEPVDPTGNAKPLTLLNLLVRQAPNQRHSFQAHARAFFMRETARPINMGLSVWKGFFQSVRPAVDRYLVNVDTTTALFYTHGCLLDVMLQYVDFLKRDKALQGGHQGQRNADVRDLGRLDNHLRKSLKMHFKGVVVQVRGSRLQPKPIIDLVDQAGHQEFDKGDQRCTVSQHFREKYNSIVKYPDIIGVKISQTAIIPAEMCDVLPCQLYRKRAPPAVQNEFLKEATIGPRDRRAVIQQAVNEDRFNYRTSDFMREARMDVNEDMVSVPGWILKPPTVLFNRPGDNQQAFAAYGHDPMTPNTISKPTGAWNVVGKKFVVVGCPLEAWGVALFDHRIDERQVYQFTEKLSENLRKLGMPVGRTRPVIERGNVQGSVEQITDVLNKVGRASFANVRGHSRPQMILVVLPEYAGECRLVVKRWGEGAAGDTPTVCVRRGKWDVRLRVDQYCNNLALKINSRLGGVNSWADSPASNFLQDCMVVGADVGHPGPGVKNKPSVTGIIASVDRKITRFAAASIVQETRVEIIQDLRTMMKKVIEGFHRYRHESDTDFNRPPRHVLFYRDGVSEGEYARVAQQEIAEIKAAFAESRWIGEWEPRLLFVIVGKRHHVRFFPQSQQDEDSKGNCLPGLLVSSQITSPKYQEFYLQSHAGLLGTSRPVHYVILENQWDISMAKIQYITYHLCHLYAGATRAVSIPAPVYYADQLCSRLDIHCPNCSAALNDAGSISSGNEPELDLEQWRRDFRLSRHAQRFSFLSAS